MNVEIRKHRGSLIQKAFITGVGYASTRNDGWRRINIVLHSMEASWF